MASVTHTDVVTKKQTKERCKDLRLHYDPNTTKEINDSDDTQIRPNTEQKTLNETNGKEDNRASSYTIINKSNVTILEPSTDNSDNEMNYSENCLKVDSDQNDTSTTDLKDVIPKLTAANGCESEIQTNSSNGTIGVLACSCQVNARTCNENNVTTSNDITTSAFEVGTNKFITPKCDVKISKRGIMTTCKIYFRSKVFTACSVTPSSSPSNDVSTSNVPSYKDTGANESVDILEIDGPNVGAVQQPLREDPIEVDDMILLFTDDDEELAYEFRDHITREIPVKNLTVHLFSNIDCGQSELTTLSTIHDRYHNILVLITPKLKLDKYQCFVNEILLTVGLKERNGKENRMSPVWTVQDKMIITAFISLKGIDYHKFKSSNNAAVKNGYKKMVKNLIIKGRSRLQ